MMFYRLAADDRTPMPCTAAELDSAKRRRVAHDDLPGGVHVSTVFLGIDHRFGGDGPPILWETMIFGGKLDGEQWRYTSRIEAEKGHAKAVGMVKARERS